ncbi:ABC-three component system protein [Pseudomonas hormoni]
MTPQHKLLARTMFQLKVHQANGFEFERVFGQVLEYGRPGFQKVRPYGNTGDRGADAYERDLGRYYQVFAPMDVKRSLAAAIKKVEVDFTTKLLPYWGGFCAPKEYFFVLNDKYSGTVFEVDRVLASLKTTHSLNESKVFLNKDLEDVFINLTEDQMGMIIGGVPSIDSSAFLDYSILGEVIRHVLSVPSSDARKSKLISPDFDEKIQFNQLHDNGDWLKAKQREVWQIDEYLSRNGGFTKQQLRESLSGFYEESIEAITFSDSDISVGDLRFGYILDKIAPMVGDVNTDRLRKDAGMVLMSKYFETCDIFEEPINASSR